LTAAASESTDVLATELALEQQHVTRVYQQLDEAVAEARHIEAESRARFMSDRSDWLREEATTALFERDAFAYQAAKRLAMLDSEHEGLVFGRLDLVGDEVRYIGRIGVRDQDYEPLAIDWRAPAAEPFYRSTSADPMGVIRRRVLRCRGEEVVGIEDDLLDSAHDPGLAVIGEGALLAALTRARDSQMHDIVATIQAEQDEAIRAPYQGVTIISGGPGTGKTVVALHRAAYLLYTHRKRLQNGGVLIVGPSNLFIHYIERVLPGLGEDAVTLRSVGRLADDVLGFGTDREDCAKAAIVKGSLAMLPLLRSLVNQPLAMPPEAQKLRVSHKGDILSLDAAQLAKIRKQVLNGRKVNQARQAAESALLDALAAQLPGGPESVSREVFEDLITSQASWRMFMLSWWPVLEPEDLLTRLGNEDFLATLGGLNPADRKVFSESVRQAVQSGTPGRPAWTISDIPLLDELANLVGPVPKPENEEPLLFIENNSEVTELVTTADLLSDAREDPDEGQPITYAHVLVDEAQDITPMQWRMLRRRGAHASWTIVGDPAQSSYPDSDQIDAAVADLVDGRVQRTFRLSKNYRSPAEISEVAGRYIKRFFPKADLPNSVRRSGENPVFLVAKPHGLDNLLATQLTKLLAQVDGTIAVIAAPSLLNRAKMVLASQPQLSSDRISLLSPLQAKGLEFDAAVLVSPDDIVAESPGGERVLYVDLTRPTRRLVTIDLDSPGVWRESLGRPRIGSG
jgi:DNA helicase IV